MHVIVLDHDIDFQGWREAARALALNNVVPEDVTWSVAGQDLSLFQPTPLPEIEEGATFSVPAAFVDLAQVAILNRTRDGLACFTECCGGYGNVPICSKHRRMLMSSAFGRL